MRVRELETEFNRKGEFYKKDYKEVRANIDYKQIAKRELIGYVYEVNYDGNIHYVTFQERYDQFKDSYNVIFPSDQAYLPHDTWAWNFINREAAIAKLNEL